MPVLKFKDPDTNEWKGLTVVSDGVTFIPSIDADGNLSWTNDGHLDNPDTINIYGKSFVNYTSITEFPAVGKENLLYIDTSTNKMYRWDTTENKYVSISGEGGSGGDFSVKVVDVLPTTGISETSIYFVANSAGSGTNRYDEYMWINGGWEQFGSAEKPNPDPVTTAEIEDIF